MERLIGPWCKKRLSAMRERKDCEMIMYEIVSLLMDRWLGNGMLVDEVGVIAPLETFSIDRMDSSIEYNKDDVRILLWGLNSLKGHDQDDQNFIKYLQHLGANLVEIEKNSKSLLDDTIRLPLQLWVVARRQCALHCLVLIHTPFIFSDTEIILRENLVAHN
jgi:hypothetical protein